MANVKPGDLAKLVYDPSFPENVGVQMWVKEAYVDELPPGYSWSNPITRAPIRCQIWTCIALQPMRCYLRQTREFIGWVKPGDEVVTIDDWLRRIDPPADTSEVFSTAPIEGEKERNDAEREREQA